MGTREEEEQVLEVEEPNAGEVLAEDAEEDAVVPRVEEVPEEEEVLEEEALEEEALEEEEDNEDVEEAEGRRVGAVAAPVARTGAGRLVGSREVGLRGVIEDWVEALEAPEVGGEVLEAGEELESLEAGEEEEESVTSSTITGAAA